MRGFLSHADLVKFAKMVPQDGRTDEDFEEIHQAIEIVRADWERRLRPQVTVNGISRRKQPEATA